MIAIEEHLGPGIDGSQGFPAAALCSTRPLFDGDAIFPLGAVELPTLAETPEDVMREWEQEEQEQEEVDSSGLVREWTTGWSGRLGPGLPPSSTSPPSNSPSNSSRRHQCLVCSTTFSTGDELEIHTIANRHQSFVCSLPACSKAYARRDACARHVATHDSKHVCASCQAEFARRDHLKRHMRVQHLDVSPRPRRAKPAGAANINIKKVKESEPALRRELSPDSLAIKMLDIAGKSDSAAEGAQKAFACVVACAALNAPGQLTPRTKRRLMTVVTPEADLEPPDLEVLKTLEVG